MKAYTKTMHITAGVIKLLTETNDKDPTTQELIQAFSGLRTSLFRLEMQSASCILAGSAGAKTADEILQSINSNRDALLKKLHDSLSYIYQTAKAETP